MAVLMVLLMGVVYRGPATAAAAGSPVAARVESPGGPQGEPGAGTQRATSDGTAPYKVLAVGLVSLALLMGILTWFYWKATVPPARRGYLPPPEHG